MDTILLPGGAGYIGSLTAKTLQKHGLIPVVYDNLSTGHQSAVQWGPFVQGDLADRKTLDQAFQTYCPKAVIHFAADAIVVESMGNPGKYYRNNIGSTVALLEAMCAHNVKHLVFSSSGCRFRDPYRRKPLSRNTPNPNNH